MPRFQSQEGTDPEFFIRNDKTRKWVPAYRFFPDKENAFRQNIEYRGYGKLFRDGYALEINVPPSHCRAVLMDSVRKMIRKALHILPADHSLHSVPAIRIDLEYERRHAPADCRSFGCEPSIDAYTMTAKSPRVDAMQHPYRYSGDHLHFSLVQTQSGHSMDSQKYMRAMPSLWFLSEKEMVQRAILAMDQYIGAPLSYILGSPALWRRRKVYGQAGEFRLQTYGCEDGTLAGLEYRTPGGGVWYNQAIASMALGIGRAIIQNLHQWKPKVPLDALRHAINTGEDLEDVLVNAPRFYTVNDLKAARAEQRFRTLDVSAKSIVYSGWNEWKKGG